MGRYRCRRLEIHVAHSCNLRCEGCLHYSHIDTSGIVTLSEAESWMAPWRNRLEPGTLNLLGGEPTLNPDLADFILLARKIWGKKPRIVVTTNGLLLHHHPRLPAVLASAGVDLDISIHHSSEVYLQRLRPIKLLVERWQRQYSLQVHWTVSCEIWHRGYRGTREAIFPFDDHNPAASFQNCTQGRECHQLLEGRLWKCALLAYLQLQSRLRKLDQSWAPYLAYEGLSPDCTDGQLSRFLRLVPVPQCAMCPTVLVPYSLPNPLAKHK